MKIMNNVKAARTALFAAGGVLLGVSVATSAMVYNDGDVLMAFRATAGEGMNQNVLVNLGSASGFRANANHGQLTSIGTVLSDTFGADWFTRGDVRAGAVAIPVTGNPNHPVPALRPAPVNGDPAATLYISQSGTDSLPSSSWLVHDNVNALVSSAAAAGNFRNTYLVQSAVEGTGGSVTVFAASTVNSWTDVINDNGYIFQLYPVGGAETVLDGSDTFLDFYRVLSSTSGADPTGDVGYAAWVTTFTIDGAGNISAIPEPGVYAALIGAAGLLLVVVRRKRSTK